MIIAKVYKVLWQGLAFEPSSKQCILKGYPVVRTVGERTRGVDVVSLQNNFGLSTNQPTIISSKIDMLSVNFQRNKCGTEEMVPRLSKKD